MSGAFLINTRFFYSLSLSDPNHELTSAHPTGASFAMWFDLGALPDPGPFEAYVATKARRWLVYRKSHATKLDEPPATSKSLANAQLIFDESDADQKQSQE